LLNASTGFSRRGQSPRSQPLFAQSRTSQRHRLERLHPPGARDRPQGQTSASASPASRISSRRY